MVLHVPSTDPFERPDKEYRLSVLASSPEDDSLSLTSSEVSAPCQAGQESVWLSAGVNIADCPLQEDGKTPYKSTSVRKRPDDVTSPPQTYLSGDELSPTASPRTSPGGSLTGMVSG